MPAFIAANYIMNYYCDHNICPMVTELPVKTDTVEVTKDVHIEQIAQVLNINSEHLRNLNPQYRRDIIYGKRKPMPVRLPVSLIGAFIDKEDSIYNYKADEYLAKRDVVEVNDDEPSYSRSRSNRSRSSVSSTTTNRNKKSGRNDRSRKGKKTNSKKKGEKSVTIRSGDTLSEIAARNGTTVKKLRKLNKISGNSIRAGKKLKVK